MNFNEETATETVVASFADAPDERFKTVAEALVRHLHAFVQEVEPSMLEWERAIDFLTAVGQRSDSTRQEFVLLSDVLGVSMLVEAINARRGFVPEPGTSQSAAVPAVTPSTVLGPFHVGESPPRAVGADIDLVGGHQPCVVTGRVTDPHGVAVANAQVDVWQSSPDGFYDVQAPDRQPPGNGRGLFHADDDGHFWFRTAVPRWYPIPTDGPVGDLLAAAARHPYRPAHIHFIVTAPGFETLTTHLFVAGSPYIDSDAVFAVNQALVQEFAEVDDPEAARRYGVAAPFRLAQANFVVRPAAPDSGRSV